MKPKINCKKILQGFMISWLTLYLPSVQSNSVQAMNQSLQSDPLLLFQDDFEDGILDGWEMSGPGTWAIENGELVVDMGEGIELNGYAYEGESGWRDFSLDVDLKADEGTEKSIGFRVDEDGGYWVNMRGDPMNDILLGKSSAILSSTTYLNQAGVWYHVRVEMVGSTIKVFVNDQLKLDYTDPVTDVSHGKIALIGWTGLLGVDKVRFDNVVVRLLNPSLIFLPKLWKQ